MRRPLAHVATSAFVHYRTFGFLEIVLFQIKVYVFFTVKAGFTVKS